MPLRPALPPDALRRRCDPAQFPFATTDELDDLPELFGQDRAKEAIAFAIGVRRDGYNLFVIGPSGSGKKTLLRQLVDRLAAASARPSDWCYVFNFERAHQPIALELPAGRGARLREDMQHLVDDLLAAIPAAFDSDEYRAKLEEIDAEFNQHHEKSFRGLADAAAKQGITLVRTPTGITLAPVKKGEMLGPDEFAALEPAEREKLEAAMVALQAQLESLMREVHRSHKDRRDRVRALNRDVAGTSVNLAVDEVLRNYQDLPEVVRYLEAVRHDLVDNAEDFRRGPEVQLPGGETVYVHAAASARYRVNLLVEQGPGQGAPVITEEHPTYQNLMGRIEHIARMGTLLTDFMLIKPGALHRANGGYLLLDAHKLLTQPFAWDALKRTLKTRRLRMESIGQMYDLVSTVSLEPQPIPLTLKVVLFGERIWYHLLYQLDPDFGELFKVAADFDDQVDHSPENLQLLARLMATVARRDGVLPLASGAVARAAEQCSRDIDDRERLRIHLESLGDLLVEADYHARRESAPVIDARHIDAAVASQIRRADRVDQLLRQEILRGSLMIDTTGSCVGQINALAAYHMGSHVFAKPTRITATARVGDGEVIDVQREIQRGGPIHSKGVLILASFLAARFSSTHPHALRASLVFEQMYEEVEGDSASAAELCALMSALSGVPIRQSMAMTGSVNQRGELQPIGAVNSKIEGFFDICSARGLTGDQGVVIPIGNVRHLMLRDDVVGAVREGRFHVRAAATIDDAIEAMTGAEAGAPSELGVYPAQSVNGRVAERLRDFSRVRVQAVRGPAGQGRGGRERRLRD